MRGEGLSASDVALLTNRNNDGGFGNGFGDGAWWIIILFLFVFCGWGNNGFGGNGSNGSGSVMDAYVLNSDFATLQRLLDNGFDRIADGVTQVNNGLCNGFYQEAQLINGVNSNIASSTATIQQSLCQGFNGLTSAIDSCCCTTQRAIDGVNYNMAMNTNAIQQTLCNNTRDIIESNNANYRALHDEIVANRIEDKNAQITAQQNEINALRLAASQEKQNNYLIDQLKPCPIPAYITCNPYQSIPYNNGGCNCGNY